MDDSWGLELQLDLYGCDHDLICDREHIRYFVVGLCELIGMTRYGEVELVRFGTDPKVTGYSMNQFIEESNITGHFVEGADAVALNIFSCKAFDAEKAREFARKAFNASECDAYITRRLARLGVPA